MPAEEPRPPVTVAWLLALELLAGGCGDGSSAARFDASGGGDASGQIDAAAAGPDFTLAPAFVEVVSRGELSGASFDTSIRAEFREEAPPTLMVESSRDGVCRMLESTEAACDPACGGDELCTAPDTCTPYPPSRSAGDLTVTSGEDSFTVEEADGTYRHYAGEAPLEGGAAVTASASGDDHPAFEVTADWPAPLAVTAPGTPEAGSAFVLEWTPADPGSRFVVMLRTDLGHGLWPPVRIECDAPDDAGQLTIPASMIDAFVDPAAWGCGDCFGSWAGRVRRAVEPGGVELWLERRVDLYFGPF